MLDGRDHHTVTDPLSLFGTLPFLGFEEFAIYS